MKKLLLATLTTLSIITISVSAEERMTKDNTIEIHKECFLHPVLVKQVEEYDSLHDLTYMKNEYYDGITNQKIDLLFETIYMDDQDIRWYFPYDGTKSHFHDDKLKYGF